MSIALIAALMLVGLVLLLIEILIIPGVGVSGILGMAGLIAGCVFSFDYGVSAGLAVSFGVLVVIAALLWYVLRAKTWQRLALEDKVESSAGQNAASVAKVGDEGITLSRLAPMGTARIGDRSLEVKSFDGLIDPGVKIVVTNIEDNIILVKPL